MVLTEFKAFYDIKSFDKTARQGNGVDKSIFEFTKTCLFMVATGSYALSELSSQRVDFLGHISSTALNLVDTACNI